jgi:hypothetical protein
MGMADSRCTNWLSDRLYVDTILYADAKLNPMDDSTKFRYFLQSLDADKFFNQPKCSIFEYKEDYSYPK